MLHKEECSKEMVQRNDHIKSLKLRKLREKNEIYSKHLTKPHHAGEYITSKENDMVLKVHK